MEIKFLARDFKGGQLPQRIGQAAKVVAFMGHRNVPVKITAVQDGCVFAVLDFK